MEVNNIYDNVKQVKALIFDRYVELNDINDNLILLALTKNVTKDYPSSLLNQQLLNYGSFDYERLEFLGDAVLDLIVSDLLYDHHQLKTPGDLTILRSKIVNNKSLICFIQRKNLCQFMITSFNIDQLSKICADMFEALIAVVYIHLKTKNSCNILSYMVKWLNAEWNFEKIINYLISHPQLTDICHVDLPYESYDIWYTQQMDDPAFTKLVANIQKEIEERYHIEELKSKLERRTKSFAEKLTGETEDELQLQASIIQRQISSSKPLPFKTQLSNFYMKYKLLLPVSYIPVDYTKYHIGVVCPRGLKCKDYFIGTGKSGIKKEAEELAAENALIYLQNYFSS